MIWYLIILCMLVLYFWKNYEGYNNLNIYPSRLLGMRRYVKLDRDGNIISMDVNTIQPGIGESKCKDVLCPKYYSDTISCYYCS